MPIRASITLLALTLTAGGIACGPDIHIHIHNYPEGTGTAGGATDASMMEDGDAEAGSAFETSGTPPPDDDGPPPETTGSPTGPADAESGDTSPGEDAYPMPEGGACAGGSVYSQPADGFEFCTPACEGTTCPPAFTGSATPFCAFNPDSSNTPCVEGDDTCMGDEICGPIPGGVFGCALPPSHCALLCDMGQQCPDGMQCAAVGACMFPA